ncbi:unnamed protein product [[Actinomadura] parvosata subsp. kistnae]|uniref:Htaa domain-containing protein n=1 Tax=[Actinomadura] parvosata subsp. kistnae TaxID=1909395 RepID=A0A1U9ZRC3_9ACTN|nr:hypothetical protein [Nonomuraea sp. ATCC 55076]AQZ60491.1 hypothetical protein BKM31_02250 [Nonomuraea sp. ATCC 55076]SPL90955.1 unnamed protein product [Actinomadura parvosata subsp. kistnae]
MLQRIRVAALALVLGVSGAVALGTPAASAAPTPTITRVELSPAAPIVVFDSDVSVTFTFTTTNATTATLKLNGDTVNVTSTAVTGGLKWTGTKSFGAGAAGKWNYAATAKGDGGEVTQTGAFDVVKALTTKIVDFDASPDLVAKGDTIRVTGRLLADGKGYDGQTVSITFRERGSDNYREVTKVTTGRGGWFGARAEANATGWWRAEFAATGTARASVSDADRVDVRRAALGSRIAGFDATPEPVDKGDTLSFSGALRVEDRGGLAGQRVSIFFKADGSRRWEYVTSDVTGRHGRFSASAEAVTSGWWRAEYRGARGINGSVSEADWVKVDQPAPQPPAEEKADTRLIKFNAYPEPVKRGKYLKFKGLLQIDDEGSWEGYSGKVALFFKPVGSKKWQLVRTTWSGDSGRLSTKAKAWKSGHWKFVFSGDDDTYGDSSRTDYVRVKR